MPGATSRKLLDFNRQMLKDLVILCATSTHPLQAVHCNCGAAAWAKVKAVSHRAREAEIECPACGAWSFWRIRRRKKTLEGHLDLVGTTRPEPGSRGILAALGKLRRR